MKPAPSPYLHKLQYAGLDAPDLTTDQKVGGSMPFGRAQA
jgi:hypothetical protein